MLNFPVLLYFWKGMTIGLSLIFSPLKQIFVSILVSFGLHKLWKHHFGSQKALNKKSIYDYGLDSLGLNYIKI